MAIADMLDWLESALEKTRPAFEERLKRIGETRPNGERTLLRCQGPIAGRLRRDHQ